MTWFDICFKQNLIFYNINGRWDGRVKDMEYWKKFNLGINLSFFLKYWDLKVITNIILKKDCESKCSTCSISNKSYCIECSSNALRKDNPPLCEICIGRKYYNT